MSTRLQRIRHLAGRLVHYRFADLQHILSESIHQIRYDTPYLEKTQHDKYRQLAQQIIGENDCVIIDVGGFDGSFARSLSRFVRRRIISFEPSISRKGDLERLVSLVPGFEYHPIALGSTPGRATLHEQTSGSLSSLHEMHAAAYTNTAPLASYEVQVSTLDIECERLGIQKPVFLKIDTQGHDFEVLRGAQGLLSKGDVFALMIEVVTRQKYSDQPLMLDLMSHLQARNFTLYDLWPIYREADGAVSEFDAIFTQKPRA